MIRQGATAIGSVSLLILAALLTIVPAATGYEPHVFSSFGPLLRVSLYGVLLGGILLILTSEGNSRKVRQGLTIVTTGYLVWFFVPVFRGYRLYGRGKTDVLAHIGRTKTLIETGMMPSSTPYTAIYSLLGLLRTFGIEYSVLVSTLAFVLTLTYILGIYCLLQNEAKVPYTTPLVAAVPIPLVFSNFHRSTHPAILSLFVVPIALLLYYRLRQTGQKRYLVLAVLAFILIVQFHPITATVVCGMVIIGDIVRGHENEDISRQITAIPALFFTILLLWYIENQLVTSLLFKLVIDPSGSPASSATVAAISQTDLSITGVLTRVIELYGAPLLYIGVGGICLLFAAIAAYDGSIDPSRSEYSLQYLVGGAIALVFYSVDLVVKSPIRSAKYLILASTVLIGQTLLSRSAFRYPENVSFLELFMAIIIISTALISVGSVYRPGNHMTEQEAEGVEWHLEHYSAEFLTVSFDMGFKSQMYSQGAENAAAQQRVFQSANPDMQLPAHLGYHENDTIGNTLSYPSYLITKTHDFTFYKWYPKNRWDEKLTYTRSDRNQLGTDRAVRKVYANGGFTVWQTD